MKRGSARDGRTAMRIQPWRFAQRRFIVATSFSRAKYLGVYTRGLPTRITLGYPYVRLQYLNPYERVDPQSERVAGALETHCVSQMLPGPTRESPSLRSARWAEGAPYAAAIAGIRTTRSLPGRGSHPRQFSVTGASEPFTLLGIVWCSSASSPTTFDARDACLQRQKRDQAWRLHTADWRAPVPAEPQ